MPANLATISLPGALKAKDEHREPNMTKTEQTTKTQKVRKISKKEERARLEAARLRQRIEREQNLSRWVGKSW